MTTPLSSPRFRGFDTNGDPLAAGKLYSYRAGTNTAVATYVDSLLSVENPNPVILNSQGEAVLYLSGSTKLVLKTSDDVTMWTMDNVSTGPLENLVVNVMDYGVTGLDTTDDTIGIQTAATAAAGKILYFPPATGYKVTTAISISANTTVLGSYGAPINLGSSLIDAFTVAGNNIKFVSLRITGEDTTLTDLYDQHSAIHVSGTKTSIYTGIEVTDCDISGFQIGICAPFTNLKARNNYIHNVGAGIVGGHNTYTVSEQALTADLYYELVNNEITCSFGTQTLSRPIALPLHTGGSLIQGNKLRGGGMSVEMVLDGVVTTNNKIIDNDCDTSISAGHLIVGNVIDLDNAPAGRGIHPSFYQAIESEGTGAIIGHNVIRNYPGGIGSIPTNSLITHNVFISCGTAAPLSDALVYIQASSITTDTDFNTIIDGNIFYDTSTLADIAVNWGGTSKARGIVITNNTSHGGDSYFLLATHLQGTVRGNYIKNCCSTNNAAGALGIWVNGANSSITFANNNFINTVAGGYGMYQGIACTATDFLDFNQFSGMRNTGNPVETTPVFTLIANQIQDGAWWPLKSGTTGNRPSLAALPTGYRYFDTTVAKQIYWNGSAWKTGDGANP